jgi:hypothetical protein
MYFVIQSYHYERPRTSRRRRATISHVSGPALHGVACRAELIAAARWNGARGSADRDVVRGTDVDSLGTSYRLAVRGVGHRVHHVRPELEPRRRFAASREADARDDSRQWRDVGRGGIDFDGGRHPRNCRPTHARELSLPSRGCVRLLLNHFTRIGWEIFVAVFRGALPGRMPWFSSGARDRTDDAVAEILFSCSDNAKSCFMISAFCDFCAFLG